MGPDYARPADRGTGTGLVPLVALAEWWGWTVLASSVDMAGKCYQEKSC